MYVMKKFSLGAPWGWIGALVVAFLSLAGPVLALTPEERIAQLEKKVEMLVFQVEALTKQLEQRDFEEVIEKPLESKHGLGPAASKIYETDHGISIGGYGEALYQNFDDGDKTDQFDMLRAVLYFGYKFNDQWVLNTEFEFEHASTSKSGSASVEFAYLDYLMRDELNFRAGVLLAPMGWVNELHEPISFFGAIRPLSENKIIPTTWRENGIGIFGETQNWAYKLYALNGFKGENFSSAGLRGGRQKAAQALSDDFGLVGRLDYIGTTGLTAGISAYRGDSGQGVEYLGDELDVGTQIIDVHVDWRRGGWAARALAVWAELDDVTELNRAKAGSGVLDSAIDSIGEEMEGYYVELGYDVLSQSNYQEASLVFFVRHEEYDTQKEIPDGFSRSGKNDIEATTLGLNFKPLDEIVFKAEYQFIEDANGTEKDQFNLGMGYVF